MRFTSTPKRSGGTCSEDALDKAEKIGKLQNYAEEIKKEPVAETLGTALK
ncbi:MAG TPA: hypothetical protein VJ249_09545 [Candidatus Bathyarchaeia archaeon]|nr:hypothetical protein [Candidatus Bathyarchaeia archaeon]